MLFNSCLIFDGVVGSAEYALETEVGKQADVSFYFCYLQIIYWLCKLLAQLLSIINKGV